jgi:hypothetical protein
VSNVEGFSMSDREGLSEMRFTLPEKLVQLDP